MADERIQNTEEEVRALLGRLRDYCVAAAPPLDCAGLRVRLARSWTSRIGSLFERAPMVLAAAPGFAADRSASAEVSGEPKSLVPALVVDAAEPDVMVEVTQKPRLGASGRLVMGIRLTSQDVAPGAEYSISLVVWRNSGDTVSLDADNYARVGEAVISASVADAGLRRELAAIGEHSWQELPDQAGADTGLRITGWDFRAERLGAMPLEAEVFGCFCEFWTFVVGLPPHVLRGEPVHRVRENWQYWFELALDPACAARACGLLAALAMDPEAETAFIELVIGHFVGARDGGETGFWVLTQLAHADQFERSGCLRRFHQSAIGGASAVILPPRDGEPPGLGHLHRLSVRLIQAAGPGDVVFFNLDVGRPGILSVTEGVRRVLGGPGQCWFVLRAALAGFDACRAWGWLVVALASLLAAFSGALLFVIDPFGSMAAFEGTMYAYLVLFPVVAAGLVLQFRAMLRRLAYCGEPLQLKQVCVIASGVDPRGPIDVKGDSFHLPLALMILKSIFRNSGNSLIGQLTAAAGVDDLALTGTVERKGRVGAVTRLKEKIDVCRMHMPPFRFIAVPAAKSEEGRPPRAPDVARCRSLMDTLFIAVWPRPRFAWVMASAVALLVIELLFSLCVVWFLLTGFVDASVSNVRWVIINEPNGAHMQLRMCLVSDHPDQLGIRIKSSSLQSVYVSAPDVRVGTSCELEMEIWGVGPRAPSPADLATTEISVVQHRRILWVSLPERILLAQMAP